MNEPFAIENHSDMIHARRFQAKENEIAGLDGMERNLLAEGALLVHRAREADSDLLEKVRRERGAVYPLAGD